MTVLKTAYDATATQGFVLRKTVDALEAANASGHLHFYDGAPMLRLVEGGASVVDSVPSFGHPLYMETANQQMMVVDARPFGKWHPEQMVFVVRNDTEYRLAIHRARLNAIWIQDSPTLLRDISQLPMSVFASWISEAVGRRYALDPKEQLNLAILSAVFYSSQFTNETELDENNKMRMVNSITRALRASAQDVLAIVDQISVVRNLTEFCHSCESATGSIRLQEMNPGVLISIVGNSWFGTNAKEMIAIALEHPPTWLAILMHAISERSYKNSAIAKLCERSAYRESSKDYMRAVLNLEVVAAR